MGLFDPRECLAARDCIQRGQLMEAARVLLKCPQREHRSVRGLLLELHGRLVEEARKLWQDGRVETAREHISMAEQCAALQGEEAALRDEIVRACEAEKARKEWSRQQLVEAERLAQQGHLRTAIELAQNLSSLPAHERRRQWEQRLQRFERYVADLRRYLDEGNYPAAYEAYRRAEGILPHDPELRGLRVELAQKAPQAAVAQPRFAPALPTTAHVTRWRLGLWAVVITADEVVVGLGSDPRVLLPVYGNLHKRHAAFVRVKRGWQITPLCDSNGKVARIKVNDSPIKGPTLLSDGSRIDFASSGCGWEFRQPVPESATACLEALPGNTGMALRITGSQRSVILMADDLVVAPNPPAHLVVPDLPCRALRFFRVGNGLGYEVQEGDARVESADGLPLPVECHPLPLPCRLVIESHLSEAELLGRMFVDSTPRRSLVVSLEIV